MSSRESLDGGGIGEPWTISTAQDMTDEIDVRHQHTGSVLDRHPYPGPMTTMHDKLMWMRSIHQYHQQQQHSKSHTSDPTSSWTPTTNDIVATILYDNCPTKLYVDFIVSRKDLELLTYDTHNFTLFGFLGSWNDYRNLLLQAYPFDDCISIGTAHVGKHHEIDIVLQRFLQHFGSTEDLYRLHATVDLLYKEQDYGHACPEWTLQNRVGSNCYGLYLGQLYVPIHVSLKDTTPSQHLSAAFLESVRVLERATRLLPDSAAAKTYCLVDRSKDGTHHGRPTTTPTPTTTTTTSGTLPTTVLPLESSHDVLWLDPSFEQHWDRIHKHIHDGHGECQRIRDVLRRRGHNDGHGEYQRIRDVLRRRGHNHNDDDVEAANLVFQMFQAEYAYLAQMQRLSPAEKLAATLALLIVVTRDPRWIDTMESKHELKKLLTKVGIFLKRLLCRSDKELGLCLLQQPRHDTVIKESPDETSNARQILYRLLHSIADIFAYYGFAFHWEAIQKRSASPVRTYGDGQPLQTIDENIVYHWRTYKVYNCCKSG